MAALSSSEKCDLCKFSTGTDIKCTILYGDWMKKKNLQVHYFCLLLSTNLQQNGNDNSGILGFELRDIKREILEANKRECCYCGKSGASIKCAGCDKYSHLVCGLKKDWLYLFVDSFKSYCRKCFKPSDFQRKVQALSTKVNCSICKDKKKMVLGSLHPTQWVYGPCCGFGYAHIDCMRGYALAAGYYLRCIWCRDSNFRDQVRLMGVFVPDRDAQWEREKNAYADLHRGYRHCDMEKCLCPQGRDYFSPKWRLILCKYCGGSGAHNPICVLGNTRVSEKVQQFKCSTCAVIEHNVTISLPALDEPHRDNDCDKSMRIRKQNLPDIASKGANAGISREISHSTLETMVQQPSIRLSRISLVDESLALSAVDKTNPMDVNLDRIDLCSPEDGLSSAKIVYSRELPLAGEVQPADPQTMLMDAVPQTAKNGKETTCSPKNTPQREEAGSPVDQPSSTESTYRSSCFSRNSNVTVVHMPNENGTSENVSGALCMNSDRNREKHASKSPRLGEPHELNAADNVCGAAAAASSPPQQDIYDMCVQTLLRDIQYLKGRNLHEEELEGENMPLDLGELYVVYGEMHEPCGVAVAQAGMTEQDVCTDSRVITLLQNIRKIVSEVAAEEENDYHASCSKK